jgi:homoserine kinase
VSLKTDSAALAGEVVVPGSVANLGGGFDTLGVAVRLYLRARILEIRDDGRACLRVVRSVPPVAGPNALERAYELAVRRTARRAPSVIVEVESDIPMAAGLGSSAAATVAGLRVFERVTGPLSDGALLAMAAEAEGHADNAAPALFGGLTSVVDVDGGPPQALRWRWPEELRLVVATPAVRLATAEARAALPDLLPRRDAVFNLQRVLWLVHALEHRQYERLREAVKDRWHQPARSALVPLLAEALRLDDPDALGVFLSGAGPSVAVLAVREFARLERLLASMYEEAGVAVSVQTLGIHQPLDREGGGDAGYEEAVRREYDGAAVQEDGGVRAAVRGHGFSRA